MDQRLSFENAIIPVLLCGGAGTRLWPMSREAFPKQFVAIHGAHTLFQQTVLRFAHPADFALPLVVANNEHRFIVTEQLQSIGFESAPLLLEPIGRNTAPAVAAAALHATELDANAVILIAPTDHMIENEESLLAAIREGLPLARSGRIVLLGIEPSSAAAGYGYIRRGAPIMDQAFDVLEFVEKPDSETAKRYVSSQTYLWNSGIFLASARQMLVELGHYAPDLVESARASLAHGSRDLGSLRLAKDHFTACPSISLDKAVIERTDKAAVIPLKCGWSDLGAWSAVYDISDQDENGNAVSGDVVCERSRNCYFRGDGALIAAVGVDDLVVIATDDVVLVARRDRDQEVKHLVDRLRQEKRTAALEPRRVHRPWGFYESIQRGHRYQVKRISVKPGAKLSLQKHFHRAEHWVVVNGTALVTRDNEQFLVRENESVYHALGAVHRLENPGKVPLNLIEVQSGAYLAEDDIVRIDDVYQRVLEGTKG